MLSSAQNASPRARLLLTRQALNPSSTAGPEQARQLSFSRFTRVTSYVHKEPRQRSRVLAFRCMDSLCRCLSWENSPRTGSSKPSIKKSVADWLQSDARANKYTDANDIKSWSDDLSGMRPGRNIEDVEREAINHLFRRQVVWSSPLHAMRGHIQAGQLPREVTAGEVLDATAGKDSLNFIDPVTNRRVSRHERGDYSETAIDDPDAARKLTPEEKSKLYEDLDDYEKPTKWNEPDGQRKLTPEEESKKYTDLNKYKPDIDDPNKPRELTPEEQSKLYEDLDQYEKPVTWNEPDGQKKPTPEEESKNYDDLDQYEGPVRWNEPDGKRPRTSEEQSKDYKDLGKYRAAFAWNEPDGKRPLTLEEKSKRYDDLTSYKDPFVAKGSIIRAYEALLNDPTVKGETLGSRIQVEAALPQYDDLPKYGPVMWNEPDGRRALTPEEKSKQYEDLHFYAQYDNADADADADAEHARVHPEVASKKYGDLASYTSVPDSEPRIHPEEGSKKYSDLKGYSAFDNGGPDVERVHPEVASKGYDDLHRYPVAGFEEPGRAEHVHPEELSKSYDDLDQYKPQSFDSIERVHPAHPEVATKNYEDLHRYEKATPLAPDESAEPTTADEIRLEVLQRAVGGSKNEQPSYRADEPAMSSLDESFPQEATIRAEAESYAQPEDPIGEEEPWAYKVLAYDPATQTVSIADTTSAADHDSRAPQNLGDILLKLSHPSKFLPHFKAAQAQGYDIVAGGGDVLIFRKTRPASPDAGDFAVADAERRKKKRHLGRKVVMGTVWVGGVAYAVGALGGLGK